MRRVCKTVMAWTAIVLLVVDPASAGRWACRSRCCTPCYQPCYVSCAPVSCASGRPELRVDGSEPFDLDASDGRGRRCWPAGPCTERPHAALATQRRRRSAAAKTGTDTGAHAGPNTRAETGPRTAPTPAPPPVPAPKPAPVPPPPAPKPAPAPKPVPPPAAQEEPTPEEDMPEEAPSKTPKTPPADDDLDDLFSDPDKGADAPPATPEPKAVAGPEKVTDDTDDLAAESDDDMPAAADDKNSVKPAGDDFDDLFEDEPKAGTKSAAAEPEAGNLADPTADDESMPAEESAKPLLASRWMSSRSCPTAARRPPQPSQKPTGRLQPKPPWPRCEFGPTTRAPSASVLGSSSCSTAKFVCRRSRGGSPRFPSTG